VTVSVTEKPVFVLANYEEYYKPQADVLDSRTFTVSKLTGGGNDPKKLFDERAKAATAKPSTDPGSTPGAWSPGGVNSYAIIDLGAKYVIKDILAYDKNSSLVAGFTLGFYACVGEQSPPSGVISSADALSMLSGSDWEKIADCDFNAYDTWFDGKTDVLTRYIAVGFGSGPNATPPGDWQYEWLDVPELMIMGYLAKGEAAPEPPRRVFEAKPSAEDHDFLYDNDFDDSVVDYTAYGADIAAVEMANADGTQGRVLKFTGTSSSPEFVIPGSFLSSMKQDIWYCIDYKFMTEDDFSAPKMALLNSYSPIFSNSGGGNLFKPQWSGDNGRRAAVSGEWHQLKAKVKISASSIISYEVFYDGASIGAATTTMTQTLPLSGIRFDMVADPNTNTSVFYYDDVWVYTQKQLSKIDASQFVFTPIQSANRPWMGNIESAFNEQLPPTGADNTTGGTPQGADPGNGNPVPGPLASWSYDAWGLAVDRFWLVDLGAEYAISDIYLMTKNNQITDVPFYIWSGPGAALPWNGSGIIPNEAIQPELQANWDVLFSDILSNANNYPNNGWGPAFHLAAPAQARYLILGCTNFSEGGSGKEAPSLQELVLYGNSVVYGIPEA
jgi:hypothetical protein